MPASEDVELTLSFADQRAVVAPLGASLRRYFQVDGGGAETDILWGYSGASNKQGGQGDALIPFPSRIRDGRYTFEGQTYQLERNDREGPNAIHGFLRSVTWDFEQRTDATVVFQTRIDASEYSSKGYPFSLNVTLTYSLGEDGLKCEFAVENTGNGAAPVGLGFHPYFTVGTETIDETEVLIPASQYLEFEPTLVPTGNLIEVEGNEWDFRAFRTVNDVKFNHCFTRLSREEDGFARAHLRNPATGQTVTVWMDETFRYLVIYTGDAIPKPGARRSLAIEPMTCATDAFNHPDWGLKILSPGEVFRGQYGVSARRG